MHTVDLPDTEGVGLAGDGLVVNVQGIRAMDFRKEKAATIEFVILIAVVEISHLARAAIAAAVYLSVEDESGPNTSTQSYAHNVSQAFSLAVVELPEGKTIGVILDSDRHIELCLQQRFEFNALP